MTAQPQKVNWWYESVVDWMIQNPDQTLIQAAKFFNCTPVWMYTLTKSDVFKELYRRRRAEHAVLVSSDVIDKAQVLADLCLDHLIDKVSKAEEDAEKPLPLKFVRDTAEFALSALGYTGKQNQQPAPQVQVQVNVVSQELLAEARGRLRQVQAAEASPPALPMPEPDATLLELTAEPERSEQNRPPLEPVPVGGESGSTVLREEGKYRALGDVF